MPLVTVLVVVLCLIIVAGLVTWIRRAASCRRIINAPQGGPPLHLFRGGVMCRHLITSGLLARLEFYDWGIRLRGITMAQWIVPTWEARYEELAIAELVTLPYSRIAVWMRLRGEPEGIAFLSTWHEDILNQFEKREIPVNRAVAKIQRVADLYGER